MRVVWLGALLLGAAPLLWAQAPTPPATPTSTSTDNTTQTSPAAAFELRIEAPDEVRDVLSRHLDLLRYREVSDLSDSELGRLMTVANEDARNLLATLGYFSPDVQLQQLPSPDAGQRVVSLKVSPGLPTLISDLHFEFTGAMADDPEAAVQRQQIQDNWPLRGGMRFSQDRWDSAKQQALRQLTTQRYPTGRLAHTSADITPGTQTARLSLTLDSGPAFQLGGLVINGLERYDAELVTRLARLTPGSTYSQAELVQAQQRLADSGFFDSAYVSLDTTRDPEHAPVMIQVREALLKKLVLGVGISTDAGPRLSLEHTHHKLPLIGWRAVSKLALDRETQTLSTELTAPPDADNWRWVTSAQLKNQQTGTADVTSQRLRGGRSQHGDRIDRTYYLEYDRADTAATDTTLPVVAESLSANYAFTLRNFDSVPFPSSGWGLGVEVGGGTTLGSQKDPYGRVLARGLAYLPLGGRDDDVSAVLRAGRIAVRAEVGAVMAKNDISLPSTQLFLTGGDTTVRGYGYRDIGVTLSDGQVSAGRYLAVGSVEWQRPITAKGQLTDWEGTLFIDAGAVADQPSELRMKVGVGAGVRWKSPIGPLQIDLAYGVDVQRFRLHMNVGFSF